MSDVARTSFSAIEELLASFVSYSELKQKNENFIKNQLKSNKNATLFK